MKLRIDTMDGAYVYVTVPTLEAGMTAALTVVRNSNTRQASVMDDSGTRLLVVFHNLIGTEAAE